MQTNLRNIRNLKNIGNPRTRRRANSFNKLNKEGLNVSNRVDKSINQFENPVNSAPVIQQGGKKTRKKFLKSKGKSKRVRFAI